MRSGSIALNVKLIIKIVSQANPSFRDECLMYMTLIDNAERLETHVDMKRKKQGATQ